MSADVFVERDLRHFIADSARLYARHFVTLYVLAALTLPLQWITLVQWSDGRLLAWRLMVIPSTLLSAVIGGALIVASNDILHGVSPSFRRSTWAALRRAPALVSTYVLAFALSVLSLIAFPYFVVRWAFQDQAVMIERKQNWSALDASSAIVSGQWWRTLGILVVIRLVPIVLTALRYAILLAFPTSRQIAPVFMSDVAFDAFTPFVIMAHTMLYYDLRMKQQIWSVPARSSG
ncbi:MAG: hypothetical protein ACYC9X_06285 [Dehalococcoidia bacterium]